MTAGIPDAAVDIRSLTKDYGDKTVLDDVDLTIADGEFVAIVGHSGSGKTTLLRIIAGLERETGGEVEQAGQVAVAFQDSRLVPWQRVWRNVTFGIDAPKAELRRRASEVLAEVGLTEFEEVWPHTLSGGQAQRVSLARALTLDPRLLLLDEPFGSLDALTKINAQSLVARLWTEHQFAVALVTHDVDEAVVLADRVIVIADGGISAVVPIDLPHPRSRSDHRVADLKAQILRLLGVDDTTGF